MTSGLVSVLLYSLTSSNPFTQNCGLARTNFIPYQSWKNFSLGASSSTPISRISLSRPSPRFFTVCCSSSVPQKSPSSTVHSPAKEFEENSNANNLVVDESSAESQSDWKVEFWSPNVPSYVPAARLSLSDQAFFLLAFIACTTSVAFTSLVIAAVPALYAMGRAAISLSKLADTAREELPSTMAAIRLSGMEISDLTLELSDLSHEIADGVNKSTQAVQAAEAGIRKIGSLARRQTMSMIQERASLPIISLQPVVAGAAKKTSRAVGQATKTFMSIISRVEGSLENEGAKTVDGLEI